jgi:predicted DNA-binding transcriptional regulator YafY
MIAAWCELRDGFRNFRADRITALTPLQLRYPTRRAALMKAWRQHESQRAQARS